MRSHSGTAGGSQIIPGAEPFFFPGSTTGCLLIHGFTGTPKEMRWLGEHLAGQGYSVLGVRLAGHATCPQDLLRVRWKDWRASVEDGWRLLSGCSEHIFAIGLSMGGVLALLHAADFPIAGVAALSTLHHLPPDWRLPYARPFSHLQPKVLKGPPDWIDPGVAAGHIDYPYYPTRAIAELRDLLVEMRQALPRITAPALVVHSKQDGGVPAEAGHPELIYQALGSTQKTLRWIEGSGHVITEDAKRQEVFQIVTEFIEEVG